MKSFIVTVGTLLLCVTIWVTNNSIMQYRRYSDTLKYVSTESAAAGTVFTIRSEMSAGRYIFNDEQSIKAVSAIIRENMHLDSGMNPIAGSYWKSKIHYTIYVFDDSGSRVITDGVETSHIVYGTDKKFAYFTIAGTSPDASKTITILNLQSLTDVKSNNGNVSYSISGDKVTFTMSNGTPTLQWNPKKSSKIVTVNKTASTDTFTDTTAYDDGTYTGTLNKSGFSTLLSGSYTPAESKNVTSLQTNETSVFPATISYSSDGYTGTLSKYGSMTWETVQTGGDYIPEDSFTATSSLTNTTGSFPSSVSYDSDGYSGTLYQSGSPTKTQTGGTYTPGGSKTASDSLTKTSNSFPATISYSSGGYTGTLSKSGSVEKTQTGGSAGGSKTASDSLTSSSNSFPATVSYNSGGYSGTLSKSGAARKSDGYWIQLYSGTVRKPDTRTYSYTQDYSGTVTKPAVDTRTWSYTQDYSGIVTKPEEDTRTYTTYYYQYYSGTVTKPAVDTRVYQQTYTGTVFSGGYDNIYEYLVSYAYSDNSNPISDPPSEDIYPFLFTDPQTNYKKVITGPSIIVTINGGQCNVGAGFLAMQTPMVRSGAYEVVKR